MTTEKFDTWEQWVLSYAVRCVERDRKVRNGETRTEQAIRETEVALSGQFQALEEETDDERRYMEIESRR